MHAPSLRRLPDVSLASVSLSSCGLASLGHRISRSPVPPYPNAQFCELHDSTVTSLSGSPSPTIHPTPPPPAQRAPRCASVRIAFVSSRVVGSVCVWCMLRHGSYGRVLHLVWRLCRVAHWLSRTTLRAYCWLPATRCYPHTKCGSAVCFLLHLACARVLLHAVCCLLHVFRWMRCPLLAVFCAVSAACRRPPVSFLPCCLLSVARCRLSSPRCLLSVACCTLPVACCVACRECSLHIA